MRAAKVQVSLRIRAVSPETPLLALTSNESRGTFRQKPRSLALLNGWACAVNIFHDGMLEDIGSLDGAQLLVDVLFWTSFCLTSNLMQKTSTSFQAAVIFTILFLFTEQIFSWTFNIQVNPS